MNQLIEYIKIHLISLKQDMETADTMVDIDYISGQIQATEHLLSVAEGMIKE